MSVNNFNQAVLEILKRKNGVGFTGAGISTESGIPDFRSADGIWTRFNINEYGYLKNFIQDPIKVWRFIQAMENDFSKASPNKGHYAFCELEKAGLLNCIITQNIDSLHQKSGSKTVYELHGSMNELLCVKCQKKYARNNPNLKYIDSIPHCECGFALKPAIIFFGEPLPTGVFDIAIKNVLKAGYMLIAGTSGSVYPAAQLPYMAKKNGVFIIEINAEPTPLTHSVTDLFFQGKIETILPQLILKLKEQINS